MQRKTFFSSFFLYLFLNKKTRITFEIIELQEHRSFRRNCVHHEKHGRIKKINFKEIEKSK